MTKPVVRTKNVRECETVESRATLVMGEPILMRSTLIYQSLCKCFIFNLKYSASNLRDWYQASQAGVPLLGPRVLPLDGREEKYVQLPILNSQY